jgi:hypothetical protein
MDESMKIVNIRKTINNRQIVKKPSPPCEIGDEDKNV